MMDVKRARVAWRGCLLILAVGLAVTGCANRPSGPRAPVGDEARPPLVFQLGQVEIVDESAAGATASDLSGAFAIPPNQALRNWAATRLHEQDGRPGILRFHMTEAEAVRTPLVGTPGVKGWFTRDQAERVEITFAGRLEARRNDGSLIASATARAAAHRTFAEKTAPAERRAGLEALQATALAEFDREMEGRIREDMAGVLD
jgi:hypothetical protein